MLKIGKSSNRRTEKEQLFPLFEEVFGITTQTLNDFSDKGYWDDTYKALSFLQEDKVIANVAAFSPRY